MTDRAHSGALTRSLSTNQTILRLAALVALVYLFILSITLLGAAFKLFGREFADQIFQSTSNPLVGLMIGLLTTSLIQSSSTTTSLIVGLVGSGVLPFSAAVPMVMGANIGTSVTNTIVSLGHIRHSDEFRRAFAGSTVHDMFNVCSVLVLFPLQLAFDLIGRTAHFIENLMEGYGGLKFTSPLAAITKPVASELTHVLGDSGILSVLVAGLFLFLALRYIVIILKSMVLSRVERFFDKYIFRNGWLALLVGLFVTTLVQSSSITTSLVVPLLGAGVVSLTQVFPYTMGANVGTTVTAFLASLVTGQPEAVSIAFAHFFFNVYGIVIFWPLARIPITLATWLAKFTQQSRLIPVLYILILFFAVPLIIIYLYG